MLGGGGQIVSAFSKIAVSGQPDIVADSASGTLTLVAGSNITITTDATGRAITINSTGGGGGGGGGGDAFLANTQTFTGLNTFSNASGIRIGSGATTGIISLRDVASGAYKSISIDDNICFLDVDQVDTNAGTLLTTTGNAATATALQTPRAINGVNFDGTAAITVTVPVSTGITGLGTGVATALATAIGSAGSFVVNGGSLGKPASGDLANCTFPTLNQSTSGNAATATTLQTPRNINGVSFNGSADITITAAAGTLTGTTLNATVVSSSLTSVGTITGGTWKGTIIDTARGGTGVDNSTGGTANTFWARPNGATGAATYRAIVAADIPTLNQNTTGNAATATTLQTPRNINGVSFNGSSDITVAAAAGTLTGTTLASGVTASSLASVGTLTGGATGAGFTIALGSSTVTGTLAVANGGTGASTAVSARANLGFVTLDTTATTGTVTIDLSGTNITFVLSLTNNVTLALSNEADGRRFTLYVRGQASGFAITWFAGIKWSGGAAPTIPTVSGRVLPIGFIRLASGEWLGIPGQECY